MNIYVIKVSFKLLNELEKIGQGHWLSNSSKSSMRPIQGVNLTILKQIFLKISCSQGFAGIVCMTLKARPRTMVIIQEGYNEVH